MDPSSMNASEAVLFMQQARVTGSPKSRRYFAPNSCIHCTASGRADPAVPACGNALVAASMNSSIEGISPARIASWIALS